MSNSLEQSIPMSSLVELMPKIEYGVSGKCSIECAEKYRADCLAALKGKVLVLEDVTVRDIENVIVEIEKRQTKAIMKTVDENGLVNTDWADIELNGGQFSSKDFARAILNILKKKAEGKK